MPHDVIAMTDLTAEMLAMAERLETPTTEYAPLSPMQWPPAALTAASRCGSTTPPSNVAGVSAWDARWTF